MFLGQKGPSARESSPKHHPGICLRAGGPLSNKHILDVGAALEGGHGLAAGPVLCHNSTMNFSGSSSRKLCKEYTHASDVEGQALQHKFCHCWPPVCWLEQKSTGVAALGAFCAFKAMKESFVWSLSPAACQRRIGRRRNQTKGRHSSFGDSGGLCWFPHTVGSPTQFGAGQQQTQLAAFAL